MSRAVLAVGALLVLGACGNAQPETGGGELTAIVTEVPAGSRAEGPENWARYPAGSRLVRVDTRGGSVVLSEGMLAAGGAVLSHDAQRVVFVGKQTEEEPYSIWECAPDGGGRRRVGPPDFDCASPAILPDGRIVYSVSIQGEPVASGLLSAWALRVAKGDGTPGERITFSDGCDLDPAMLRDGRIAYTAWLAQGRFALFTVHPDGTGAALFHDPGVTAAPGRISQAADGNLLHVVSGEIREIDWRASSEPATVVRTGVDDAVAVDTAPGGAFVVAGRARVVVLDGDGREQTLASASPGYVFADVAVVTERTRPQGQLSMVRAEKPHGDLLALDARVAGSTDGVRARLSLARGGRPLGEIQLAPDGSFFARVPADVPLLLDILDAGGQVVASDPTPFWVRPNETRACVGCHEPGDTAPPNRRPQAILEEPVSLVLPPDARKDER